MYGLQHAKRDIAICLNCRLGSVCAIHTGLSETILYDYIRFCAEVDLLKTTKIKNIKTTNI